MKVVLENVVRKENQDRLDQQDLWAQEVLQEREVGMVLQELLAYVVLMDCLDHLVLRDQLENPDHPDFLELWVEKVIEDLVDQREVKVYKDLVEKMD